MEFYLITGTDNNPLYVEYLGHKRGKVSPIMDQVNSGKESIDALAWKAYYKPLDQHHVQDVCINVSYAPDLEGDAPDVHIEPENAVLAYLKTQEGFTILPSEGQVSVVDPLGSVIYRFH